jgi:mannose-binding lectin 1
MQGQNPQNQGQQQQQYQAANTPPQNQQQQQQQPIDTPSEAPASDFKSSDAQFADLHNRLQAMMKHISALNRDLSSYQANSLSRIETLNTNINSLSSTISRLESSLSKLESIPALERNLRDVQNDVKTTKKELHEALDQHVLSLKQRVSETHGSVLGTVGEGLRSSGGVGLGAIVLVVVGSQVGLVVAYMLYKKRKNGGSKKYL